MCGIVGIFDVNGQRTVNADLLNRMNESQHHRGPDEGGLHTEPGVGLGHRRLSIIDLSSGQQPLFNEDGSVVVVFNGEIYNFAELMAELQSLGHRFRTRCDTEVIVHAWEQWGEGCVERFRGMFAFALWDRNQQSLFLARDRFGVKPLYYALLPGDQFIFGSELKALMIHPGLKRDIDPLAVEDYFAYGYVPEPKTIFKSARKLPPGYILLLKRNDRKARLRRYWDISFQVSHDLTEWQASQELIDRLREAIKIRMVAEVPLGAFLSGGVDSSAVVAMMAGLSQDPVNTCSIGFNVAAYNESQFSALVAERYHTHHNVDMVESDDYDLVDTLARIYDEPYADSSAIPTYRVCQLAKRHVTVALSGDGGDESLAGYRRYRWHMNEERLRALLPQNIRGRLFGFLGNAYPKMDWAPKFLRAKTTFQALALNSIDAYFHSVSTLNDGMRSRVFSSPFRAQLQGYNAVEVLRNHAQRAPEHPLSAIQYLDFKTYLVGDINTKVDRASMAHALEVREPLMDHKLVEWFATLPPEMKLRGRDGKHIFKKSLEPHLPADVLYRPKMGFAVPLSRWFRGPLRQRIGAAVRSPTLGDTGYFNMEVLARLADEHISGMSDHSTALWSILMFDAFLRTLNSA